MIKSSRPCPCLIRPDVRRARLPKAEPGADAGPAAPQTPLLILRTAQLGTRRDGMQHGLTSISKRSQCLSWPTSVEYALIPSAFQKELLPDINLPMIAPHHMALSQARLLEAQLHPSAKPHGQ
jgi:hypothetical protein